MKISQMSYSRAIIGIALLALIVIVTLLLFGFRLGSGLSIQAPGTLLLTVPLAQSEVYLDGSKETQTVKDNEVVRFDRLSASLHTVVVSKTNFWPWKKDVTVKSNETLSRTSFLLPQSVSGSKITGADPEYERIKEIVESNISPTFSNKITSPDKSVSVWLEGNTLFAEWLKSADSRPDYFCKSEGCDSSLIVLQSGKPIRSVAFYKDNHDLLIVSLSDTIAVIDLNPYGTQNFQPLYKGTSPLFALSGHNSLFVIDQSSLLEIEI